MLKSLMLEGLISRWRYCFLLEWESNYTCVSFPSSGIVAL